MIIIKKCEVLSHDFEPFVGDCIFKGMCGRKWGMTDN